MVGTMGDIGCFSLNDYKHISVGDGGAVITNDPQLARRAQLFADKCYDREQIARGAARMPKFLAANYRMSELNGAVGIAQLDRLAWIVGRRRELGDRLNERLRGLPGISPQLVPEGYKHSYYLYTFRIDARAHRMTPEDFSAALAAEGIPNSSGGITGNLPVYLYDLFTKKNIYEGTQCPFDCRYYDKKVEYGPGLCPNAEQAFKETISLKISEHYSDQDLEDIARGIRKVAGHSMR
jgi:dTDP-4-amino-4,6-dideoxygalactose transaminase